MKISIIFTLLSIFIFSGCTTKNVVPPSKQKTVIKTKKSEFYTLKKELDYKFGIVEKKEESLADASLLESFRGCVFAKKLLADIPKTLTKIHSLKSDFNDDDYLEKLKSVDDDYEKIKSNITFSVKASNSSRDLEDVLYDALERENLQISDGDYTNHLDIILSKKTKRDITTVFITLKDAKGRVFTKNKVDILSDDIAMRFYEKIKKEGLDRVLGLSL